MLLVLKVPNIGVNTPRFCVFHPNIGAGIRKVDIRLPGNGNVNPHGVRAVHSISSVMKWIRTSWWSIKDPLSPGVGDHAGMIERFVAWLLDDCLAHERVPPPSTPSTKA